jgi:hypothetical protein
MAMGKVGTRVVFPARYTRSSAFLGRPRLFDESPAKNFLRYPVLIGKETCMRQHQAKSDSVSGWVLPHPP